MIGYLKQICLKYNIDWKFIKFLFVGGINTLFAYTVYAFSLFFGCHYTLATLVSNVLGVLFNFKTTGCIVFKNNENEKIFKFVFVYVFMYFLTIIELKMFSIFGFENMYLNYAIIVLPNAFITFSLMKKFVFMTKHE